MSTVWSSVQANGSWQGSADIFMVTYPPKLTFKNFCCYFETVFCTEFFYCFSRAYHTKVLQWVSLNSRVSFSFNFMHPPYFLWLRTLITISKISATTGVTHSSLSRDLCHIFTELRFGTAGYWKISLLQTLLKLSNSG